MHLYLYSSVVAQWFPVITTKQFSLIALTLLVGRQEGHPDKFLFIN